MIRLGHFILLLCIIVILLIAFIIAYKKNKFLFSFICWSLSIYFVLITVLYSISTSVRYADYNETFAIRFLTMNDTFGQILFSIYSPNSQIQPYVRTIGFFGVHYYPLHYYSWAHCLLEIINMVLLF